MRKFSALLFQLLVPASIIFFSLEAWSRNIALNIITQLGNYFKSFSVDINYLDGELIHVTKPEPAIDWGFWLLLLLGFYLINKKLVKPFMQKKLKKMDFEERKRNIMVLTEEVVSQLFSWTMIYIALTNLGAAYDTKYFFQNALNWMMISILVGEIVRISETFSHIKKYFNLKG